MLNFEFCSPTKYVFGRDTQQQAGRLIREAGGTRALVVYGGGSAKRSGLLAQVLTSLDEAGVAHVELGGVRPNPRSGLGYEDREDLEMCECWIQKVDGKWRVAKEASIRSNGAYKRVLG